MHSLKLRPNKQYFINKANINRFNNQQVAYQIQVYNDNLIDDLVLNYDNYNYVNSNSPSMLFADLAVLNKPVVYANYNMLMNNPLINNDQLQLMLIRNKASKDLDAIVEKEVARISDNVKYVEQVLNKYNIPTDFYEKQIRKQTMKTGRINRKQLLEQLLVRTDEINRSEGLNIPKPFNYRNPDVMAENLLREQKMTSENSSILELNRLNRANGDGDLYTRKEWVWTGRGQTTRHRSNDGQVVNVNDKFLVRNDKSGVLDYMDFPHDPLGSWANSGICYCECRYF